MPSFSLIIPAHNEEAYLGPTLESVRRACAALGDPTQVIVVNDASTDATGALAAGAGAEVLNVNIRQIAGVRNAGARASRGEVLVFLDADTILPTATLLAARKALAQGAIGGGCRVCFDTPLGPGAWMGLNLWNGLSRSMRWAAGSFIFVRRQAFLAAGGFDERYFAAEELFLSEALKKQGPFKILHEPVVTSARKLKSHGLIAHSLLALRMALSRGRVLRSRQGLDLWYGQRGEGKK